MLHTINGFDLLLVLAVICFAVSAWISRRNADLELARYRQTIELLYGLAVYKDDLWMGDFWRNEEASIIKTAAMVLSLGPHMFFGVEYPIDELSRCRICRKTRRDHKPYLDPQPRYPADVSDRF